MLNEPAVLHVGWTCILAVEYVCISKDTSSPHRIFELKSTKMTMDCNCPKWLFCFHSFSVPPYSSGRKSLVGGSKLERERTRVVRYNEISSLGAILDASAGDEWLQWMCCIRSLSTEHIIKYGNSSVLKRDMFLFEHTYHIYTYIYIYPKWKNRRIVASLFDICHLQFVKDFQDS